MANLVGASKFLHSDLKTRGSWEKGVAMYKVETLLLNLHPGHV